ncbi:unnamed protein product [Bursaphelenchus xylophilus]|uniref:(pine wood nematode) hypothetical protein n=1 Tax=Bursaphelenchus xylophilus TaxID=6326 RepID=A0A1I7RI81_BURXY|nr:unnamed protein product [Bursaphelenchus xylophilus]CAG9115092.1 unnamed protein product [Bursaphelenchus xylophilus]
MVGLADKKKSYSVQLGGILYKEPTNKMHFRLPGEPLTLVIFERTLMFMRKFEVLYIIELAADSEFSFSKHHFELFTKDADQVLHHLNFCLENRADEQNFCNFFSRVLKNNAENGQKDPLVGHGEGPEQPVGGTALNSEYVKTLVTKFSSEAGRLFGHIIVDLAESFGRAIQSVGKQPHISDSATHTTIKQSVKRKRPPPRNTSHGEVLRMLRDSYSSGYSEGAEKASTELSDDGSLEDGIAQHQKRIRKNPAKRCGPRKVAPTQAEDNGIEIPEKEESQAEDNEDPSDDSDDSSDESNLETQREPAIQTSSKMSPIQAEERKDQIPQKEEIQAEDYPVCSDGGTDSSDEFEAAVVPIGARRG